MSVLMSVYNGADYLADALDSVLTGSFPDFEFIVVNDGSTDGTRAILDTYASQDARVITIDVPTNCGLPAALNLGLGRARGQYVARLDADDLSEPTRLTDQTHYMDTHPGCVVLGTWFRQTDPDNVVFDERTPREDSAWIVSELASGRNPIAHGSVMLRRGIPPLVAGYDERFRYSQDYDLWLRIAKQFPEGFAILQSFGYRRRKLPMTSPFKSLCQARFGEVAREQYHAECRVDFGDIPAEIRSRHPRSLDSDPTVSGRYWLQLSQLARRSQRNDQARAYGLRAFASSSTSIRAKAAFQLAMTYVPQFDTNGPRP